MSRNVFNEPASMQAIREYERTAPRAFERGIYPDGTPSAAAPGDLPETEGGALAASEARYNSVPGRPRIGSSFREPSWARGLVPANGRLWNGGGEADPERDFSTPSAGGGAQAARMPENLLPLFEAAAARHQVPINILQAIAEQESGYNPTALGPRTQWGRARGIMQFFDSTADGLGINPYDPAQSIDGAARQIADRLRRGYSMDDAVREHFAGPDRARWGARTARYGEEVMARAARIADEIGDRYAAPPPAAETPAQVDEGAGQPANPYDNASTLRRAGDQLRSGVESARQGFATLTVDALFRELAAADRADAGASPAEAPLWAELSPAQRAQLRERYQAALGERIQAIVESQGRQSALMRNPRVAEMAAAADAGNWGEVWRVFRSDPAGILQQLSVESVPHMAAGVAGAVAGGAAGAAVGAGRVGMLIGQFLGSYGADAGPRAVENLTERMKADGVDVETGSAVAAWLRANPQAIREAAQAGQRGAYGPAAADALSLGLARPLMPGRGILPNARVGAGNLLAEVVPEGVGEAAAGVLAEGEVKPSDVLMEMLGAGPQAVATTGLSTAQAALARPSAPADEDRPAPDLEVTTTAAAPTRREQMAEIVSTIERRLADGTMTREQARQVLAQIARLGDAVPDPAPEPEAAGPLASALGQQSATGANAGVEVMIETEGLDPIPGTIEYETPEGVMVRTAEGMLLVPADEISAGTSRVVPINAQPANAPEQEQAQAQSPRQQLAAIVRRIEQGIQDGTMTREEGRAALLAEASRLAFPPDPPVEPAAPAPAQATPPGAAAIAAGADAVSIGGSPRARLAAMVRDIERSVREGAITRAQARTLLREIAKLAPGKAVADTGPDPAAAPGGSAAAAPSTTPAAAAPNSPAPDGAPGGPPPSPEPGLKLETATEPQLRDHLRYLAQQARGTGWTKPLLARRAATEAAINKLTGATPKQPGPPTQPAPTGTPPMSDARKAANAELRKMAARLEKLGRADEAKATRALTAPERPLTKRDMDRVREVLDGAEREAQEKKAEADKAREQKKAADAKAKADAKAEKARERQAAKAAKEAERKAAEEAKAAEERPRTPEEDRAWRAEMGVPEAALDFADEVRAIHPVGSWFITSDNGGPYRVAQVVGTKGAGENEPEGRVYIGTHSAWDIEKRGDKLDGHMGSVHVRRVEDGVVYADYNRLIPVTQAEVDAIMAEANGMSPQPQVTRLAREKLGADPAAEGEPGAQQVGAGQDVLTDRSIDILTAGLADGRYSIGEADRSRARLKSSKGDIELHRYGNSGSIQVIAWIEPGPSGAGYMGSTMPGAKLNAAIAAWDKESRAERDEAAAPEPRPKAGTPEQRGEIARLSREMRKLAAEWDRLGDAAQAARVRADISKRIAAGEMTQAAVDKQRGFIEAEKARRAKTAVPTVTPAPEPQAAPPATTQPQPADTGVVVAVQGVDALTKVLADMARRTPLDVRQDGGRTAIRLKGQVIATFPSRPAGADPIVRALGGALADAMRETGQAFPSNPEDMTRDQFAIAYQFSRIIPEFEVDAEMMAAGVIQDAGDGLTVNPDRLYDAIQKQKAARAPKLPAPEAEPAAAEPAAEPAAAPVSALDAAIAEAEAELAALFKAQANRLNAGVDPAILGAGAKLGALYVAKGVLKFAEWAKAVVDAMRRMGVDAEQVKPTLKEIYMATQARVEDAQLDQMDDIRAVRAFDLAALDEAAAEPVTSEAAPTPEENPTDAGSAIYEEGAGPLAGVAPEDGGRDAPGGDAEPGSAEGEQGSGATGGEPDGGRPSTTRGGRNRAPRPDSSGPRGVGSKGRKPKGAAPAAPDLLNQPEQPPAPINAPAVDFTIDDSLDLGKGSESQKYQDNLTAIRTLKAIEEEGRRATAEEQRILARYVGWGGLKNAFRIAGAKPGEGIAKGWEKRVAELEELLTPAELRAARASTKAAHYTSQAVVQAMWRAAERLGFQGGSVLEPSVGTGNFLGLMPPALRGTSRVFAVEYDSLTARIAQKLYPNMTIVHAGFQNVPLPSNQFALAIGNPPFGRESLFFRSNPAVNGKSIHNQFFMASLDAVAPGGLMSMVVSHNLMDALDPSARLALAAKAEFIGGVRLPDTAFKENARTEVVTDILFFRKRPTWQVKEAQEVANHIASGKEAPKDANQDYRALRREMEGWTQSSTIDDPEGSGEKINANPYFLNRPGQVVGRINATGTMNARADLNVTLDDPSKFEDLLNAAINRLGQAAPVDGLAARTTEHFDRMADAMRLALARAEVGAVSRTADGALKMVVGMDGGDLGKNILQEITLNADTPFNQEYDLRPDGKWERTQDVEGPDGKPLKVLNADGKPTKRNQKETTVFESAADIPTRDKWGAARIAMLEDMLPIRNLVKRQLVLETQDAPERMIEGNREKLNAAYDAFVEKHGQLHSGQAQRIAGLMPDGGLILSVEQNTGTRSKPSFSKAPIMSRRVATPPKPAESARDANEAVLISLAEMGRIDLPRVAALLGTDEAGAEQALGEGDNPRAFFDPETQRWEPRDTYLSGLVRRKLNAAREAGLEKNVKALESVMPEDWSSADITPNLGSAWIPGDVYADFLKHLGYDSATVSYSGVTNSFSVTYSGTPGAQWALSDRARPVGDIVNRALNSQSMKIVRTDNEGKTYTDVEGTQETEAKLPEVLNEFLDWAYQDDTRRTRLVSIFNERFNTRIVRQRDGSHLTLPGKVPDEIIKMRRHQTNAIWRGITDSAVLYDHVVGAGKTFTAIARIMERRRMGLSQKPLVVVPNHLVQQWAEDVTRLYPAANVLAAGKADFERKNRRRLFARIASGDYDMAIIGHSSFGFIDLSPDTEERFLMDELQRAMEGVREAERQAEEDGTAGGRRKPFGVKEAERLVTKIEERLARLREGRRDRLLTFEEMGIDDLTVDEAHEFKNLSYSSRLTNVSGMGNKTGSQKAMDLHLKIRALRERKGSSVAFLTGTPISNSAAEMYLVLRNLAPQELSDMGMDNFDAWRSVFVSTSTAYEPTESGGLKEVARLGREWQNMRSLMDLYYSVSDAVTIEDIEKAFAEDNPGKKFPVPTVVSIRDEGKDRREIVSQPSPEQRAILQSVVDGYEGLQGITDPYERNKERLKLMDRARKVALDARAVDPRMPVAAPSPKLQDVMSNVVRLYKKWDADKGTQIVFLDRSVPVSRGDDKIVAEYDALRAKLRQAIAEGDAATEASILDDLVKFDPNEIEELRNALAGGWNAYDEIKAGLIAQGIPADEIRYVQEANTDIQKQALFDLVKSGKVRVLMGSTPRLGAGTNVQDRLVGLHHVDVTWKPSDIEQREGRIRRQGNLLLEKYGDEFAVEILAYATEMTIDAKMWALNSAKLRTINGIRKYDGSFTMEFEDEESAGMAEMAALATGDARVVEKVILDGEIKKLEVQQRSHSRRMAAVRDKLRDARNLVEKAPDQAAGLEAFSERSEAAINASRAKTRGRKVLVAGKDYTDADAAEKAAEAEISRQQAGATVARYVVDVDGKGQTSKGDIAKAIRAALGTPGFVATFKGVEHIDLNTLARAIVQEVNSASESEVVVEGITMTGVPIRAEVRGGFRDQHYLAIEDETGTVTYTNGRWYEGPLTVAAVQGALPAFWERMVNRVSGGRLDADMIRARAKEAERELPTLEEEVAKPWAKAEELAEKRARLQVVIESIGAGGSFATRLAGEEAFAEPEGEAEPDIGEMRAQMPTESSVQNQSAPVAFLTGQEIQGEDIAARRRAARAWMQKYLRGKSFYSEALEAEVTVNRRGLEKTLSGNVGERILDGVPAIADIIERGELVETMAPRSEKGDTDTKAWHRLVATVMVNGEPREYRVLVREGADGSFHYRLEADRAEIGAPLVSLPPDQQGKAGSLGNTQGAALNLEEAPAEIKAPAGWGVVDTGNGPSLTPEGLSVLREILNRIAGPEAVLEAGLTGDANGIAAGALVRLASRLSEGDAGDTMLHEAIHILRNLGRISAREWSVLTDAVQREGWIKKFGIDRRYAGLPEEVQLEEAVAEAFMAWAGGVLDTKGPVGRAFQRIKLFLTRLRNALARRGFTDYDRMFQQIADGRMGARPVGGAAGIRRGADVSPERISSRLTREVLAGRFNQDETGVIRLSLPAAKQKEVDGRIKTFLKDVAERAEPAALATLPLRPLLEEIGRDLPSAQKFLRTKQAMDAMRAKWFATSAEVTNRWLKHRSGNKADNNALMEIMHASTLAGIDPSKPDSAPDLRARFLALSKEAQALYVEVRDTYKELADAFDAALMSNVGDAVMARAKRADRIYKREVARIEASKMDAEQKANAMRLAKQARDREVKIASMNRGARMTQLRQQFETQRKQGPYFPLARFGEFFVTARNDAGEVVSFSRFEKPSAQRAFAREMEAEGYTVQTGRMSNEKDSLRSQVDPRFVAEVEALLQGAEVASDLQDAIWQRFLERMPDMSIRTRRIHRKGTSGYHKDAIRAFAHHMFHGSHQLARLQHAMQLHAHVEDAREEARDSKSPNRATAIVNEMQHRMDFIMNPTGAQWAHHLTSAGFVYFLSASPAAAIVNLSQTVIMGVPILGATKGATMAGAATALSRALKDVAAGKGTAAHNKRLTDDERALIREIYEIGLADSTQAHDLAGVKEGGGEYNAARHKVMSVLSWAYHHAERVNREATALAAYRMQRKAGMDHAAAVEEANRLTWKVHFDYQNTSRPRFMQNDAAKVVFLFRSFTINMLFRLFRDVHEAMRGESAAARREARNQLVGTTMMMMATAGIRGTWGFGIAMMLAGVFFGPSDDAEDELRKWLQSVLGVTATAVLMDGIPGYALGVSLSERIGMPDLWFRSPDRQLEGKAGYWYWVGQALGPIAGMGESIYRGADMALGDNPYRGVETAVPKAVRDLMRAGRYTAEGALNLRGDALLESVPTADVIRQAIGFTPARLAEIYQQNNSARNAQEAINDARQKLTTRYHRAWRADDTNEMRRIEGEIQRFNDENPTKAITPRNLVQSIRQRERFSAESKNGLRLEPRLDQELRGRLPAPTYN